tara:strand:+ start:4010 stop:4969 length:960 start_codon:yes stop_codon:yes gene_type:complete
MPGPTDPEDDVTYITNVVTTPTWTEAGVVPTDGIDTFKRTNYITDMVAGNLGFGTPSYTQSMSFIGDYEANDITQNANDGLAINDNASPPMGSWVISPSEKIPVRGYNAVTCSLVNRVRQMWQLQLNDVGQDNQGESWAANEYFDLVNVGGTYNQDSYLFEDPPTLDNTFGFTPGPYKMSDFYNKGHFGINCNVVEEETGTDEITIYIIYSYNNGLRVIGEGHQLHLGGNSLNPEGVNSPNQEGQIVNSGENVGFDVGGDVGFISEANVTTQIIDIHTLMEDPNLTSEANIISKHYDTVSNNIINVLIGIAETELNEQQ